ncbi:DUF2953 domain-containing protein [Lentibacillus sp. CBA3610]|uniref:DUF2953 domain-containing protein n=1 Tax=Lentibacillus sp. CBA3610 TaxID=2518176 RepID=UPI0015962A84|nr:DUF2953 domain-containing protein [Lentibacillus sp. CBA3610]QKY69689.1 DUF2953 domain-containing protein [Lentibacillus sp. CBA3610]
MVIGLFIVVAISGILLLLSRIKVVCSVTLNPNLQTLYLAVYVYRIRLLERSIDLSEADTDQEQSFQEVLSLLHKSSRNFIQKIRNFYEVATLVLERLRFHSLSWHTEVGTGKAHTTGMVTGGIWSVQGTVIGLLSAKSHLDCKPSIEVTPFFNQKRIDSKFDCMFSIRIGQAIYALLKIIRKLPAKREAVI